MSVRKKRSVIDISEPKDFIVDHPFVYQVNHRATDSSGDISSNATTTMATNLTLFMGSKHQFAVEEIVPDHKDTIIPDSSSNRITDEL